MTRRRLLKFVLPVVAVLAVAGIALAFWSSTGTGPSAGIAVASLPGPANVAATVTPGANTVSVDWDAAQLSSGQNPEGYRVTKTDQSSTTTDACGTNSTTFVTASTDCSDTSVPDGVYTYKVIAVYHSFTGTGTAGTVTHVATETGAPTATLGFPADTATYNNAGFDAGCTTAGLCGTASDTGTGASGVHTVQVAIQQGSGNYFGGTSFDQASEHYLPATFNSGTGNWSFAFDHTKLPADGNYTVSVKATDWGGNVSSVVSHTFTLDTVAPTISSLAMKDTNHNGKVDQVVATFNDNTLQSSTDTSVWHLSNVPSGGSLASVSTSGATATLTLNEGSGAADTSVGSFTVSLDASATGIRDAAGNQASFSAQAPDDQAPPARIGMVMQDTGGIAGKVDQVSLTFSENLAGYTAGNTPWTLANVPSGGSLNNVNVSGTGVTLSLNEGSGAADTSLGTFTVALAADANGIRDAAGNQTSFAAAAPTDGAAPVRTSMAMFDTTANGKVDRVQLVYSEPLANYTAGNTPWNLKNVPSGGTLSGVTRGTGANQNILTLAITEGPNAADTSVGSFTLAYTAGSTAARDAAGNQAVSFGDTAPTDAAAPARTSMTMVDNNNNGKIDHVNMTFSENLDTYTAANSVWSFANVPGGATLDTVAVTGSSVTLNLTEGSVATGLGNPAFTIALGANAAGIRDAADNRTSFAATSPTDGAAPIRTSLSAQDADSNGRIDGIVATYSETMAATTDASLWTFAGTTPGGGSKGTVSASGSSVTVAITGSGVDTSVPGDFTVAYTAGGTGAKDAAGNQAASAGASAPTDAAPPIRTSMVMQDANPTNGKADQVVSTYSENVQSTTDATLWAVTGGLPGGGTKGGVTSTNNQVTLAINEGSTTNGTAVGFTLAYTAGSTGVKDAAGNQSPTVATIAPTDGAAPFRTGLVMQDANTNGKVDRIQATYSETIVNTTPDATLWSLGGTVPSNGTKGALTIAASSNIANLAISEGAGAADTSVGTLTVGYTAAGTGIRDTAGNQATSFSADAPTDGAAPVPVSVSDSDTGATTDGKFAAGDSMTVTFSEDITGLPTTSTVTLTDKGAGGNNDGVAMVGLISGTANLNAAGYISNAGTGIATFSSSAVSQTAGTKTFTVTLAAQTGTGVPTQQTTAAAFNYVPAATITDTSSNHNAAVANSTLPASFTIRLF